MTKQKQKRAYTKRTPNGSFTELLAKQAQYSGRTPRIRTAIENLLGKQLPDLVQAMCDDKISTASIHKVLLEMGVKVSYMHLHKVIRPDMVEDYGYYYNMVSELDREYDARNVRVVSVGSTTGNTQYPEAL